MTIFENIHKIVEQLKITIKQHLHISEILEIEKENSNIYYELKKTCLIIEERLSKNDIKENYLKQLQQNFNNLLNQFPYKDQTDLSRFKIPQNGQHYKQTLENSFNKLKVQLDQLNFNFDFFNKLNFFSNNIVAIGANGSGKTSLANHLKGYLQNNGIIVSAQRVLNIPQFNSIQNPTKTLTALNKYQQYDKTYKSERSYDYLHNEFNIVLQNLLADNISENNNYTKKALELAKNKKEIPNPEISKLIKAFSIWNDLIEHRIIETVDGINIVVKTKENPNHYQAIQMSDGEKVILYLIAQILQAPKDGFIIVDEPEMHLHKTILRKLWDRLEAERDDCIFIYLTHDLDFATSRNTSKKIWLKSFTPPQNWEMENIPTNDLPESLMLELLGSRKTILFCESEKGKIDETIYQHLFPNYTIMPVGSCTSVINYTRAYNKLPNIYAKAFGIIDADFHEIAEIEKLKTDNIFTYSVAEPENLFLNSDFIRLLAKQLMKEEVIEIENIKSDIITKFETDREIQISNYLSAKINYHFSVSHVQKGNTKLKVAEHLANFNSNIKIENWYSERETLINKIITEKNYDEAILHYNNKGLKQILNQHFKIADFQESSLRLLSRNKDAKDILLQYYPNELK
jgi:ABC-type cobalamin/Fe3+-siderophores transport system ATPase subunit